jgi:hypothetical protein
MENISTLPYDVLRIILSSPQIPCSTKVELQNTLGNLTNKLHIESQLKHKLDRIMTSRNINNRGVGGTCKIESDDGKVRLSIFVDKLNRHVYTFNIRKDMKVSVVTYDDLLGEDCWRTSRTIDYEARAGRFLSRFLMS